MTWHCWGEEDGEPLVLLHGGSGSWTHWLRNVEPLASAGRRVFAADLPGFGDSVADPQVTDVDGMVEPLVAGLQEVVGQGDLQVVGFSLGGLASALVAAQQPSLVRHLVLAGAPGFGLRASELKLRDWRHLQTKQERDAVHRANIAVLLLHDPQGIDEDTVRLHAANMARDRLRHRRIARTDILARTLPTLRCPVDGIWGEFDQLYAGLMPDLQGLLSGFPNFGEFVVIPGAGHWVPYEAAAAFNKELLRLLQKR